MNKLICPIISDKTTKVACIKEECGFWDRSERVCGVVSISMKLERG